MIAADAEIYYQSPAGAYTGITAWFCRATGRRFIFRVASDSDCEKEHGRIQFWRDRKLYNYGLRRADVIAAQTEFQAQLLRENHGLDEHRGQHDGRAAARGRDRRRRTSTCCGSATCGALKRPELALELARQLPQVKFTLAGGPMPGGQTYFEDVMAAAARAAQRHDAGSGALRGYAARCSIARRCSSTPRASRGFPNTFLQAWIRGVPVVSFFDPDSLVQRLMLGRIATSLDDMREAIRGPARSRTWIASVIGRRARDFATREYTTGVAARYLELLDASRRNCGSEPPETAQGTNLP